jgi:AcrR family transcriptional regulator
MTRRSTGSSDTPFTRFDVKRRRVEARAARLFATQGFASTSIDDLSEITGLQRGGLYHYIGSKKDLLLRIHARFISTLLAEARAIEASGERPAQMLASFARVVLRNTAGYADQVATYTQEWRLIAQDPAWAEVRAGADDLESIVAGFIERGVADGAFSRARATKRDRQLLARVFLGMLLQSHQWLPGEDDLKPSAAADLLSGVFINGLVEQ